MNQPNWMNYPPLLEHYERVRAAENVLEPDADFLKDPSLGRYESYQLNGLDIPQTVKDFLMQVGLPDKFLDHRSPDEERDSRKSTYFGVIFWVSCLRIETIKRKKYLVIGEYRGLNRTCTTVNFGKPDRKDEWHKHEEFVPIVVELKTGTVWKWIHYTDEDFLTFINSSLEQYLLSMAYWRTFYPDFEKKVTDFLEKNPKKIDLDYIFRNEKTLYAPFRHTMDALDPAAFKKRMTYWKCMCDLSLI